MKYLALHENKIRGSKEFPFAFYLNKQQPHFELPFHWHDEYEVIYVTKGEFELTINKDTYTLKKGESAVIMGVLFMVELEKNCSINA